jgi:hypothetical protein
MVFLAELFVCLSVCPCDVRQPDFSRSATRSFPRGTTIRLHNDAYVFVIDFGGLSLYRLLFYHGQRLNP